MLTLAIAAAIAGAPVDSLPAEPVDSVIEVTEVTEIIIDTPDTTAVAEPFTPKYVYPGWRGAWEHDFTYGGVPFLAAGLIIWGAQDNYRDMARNFLPHFNSALDNMSQYSPLAVTALLKVCGVKTRSNWGRFAVSSAFSAGIMAATVNSVKYSVKEMRPDNTTRNSFPSGHTATAFMCAHIMSKELGWRSPWYSIGAYGVAATTGIFRILNNRHWINDVVFGAGIGITAVDLGYFLGDVIFKDKGIDPRSWTVHDIGTNDPNPTFIALSMAVGSGSNLRAPAIYDDYLTDTEDPCPASGAIPMNLKLKMGVTTSVAVEGAWFWNRYFGIGGRARAIACPIVAEYNHNFQPYVLDDVATGESYTFYRLRGLESAAMGVITVDAGPYASLPIGSRWRIGAKLLGGTRITTHFNLHAYSDLKPEYAQLFEVMKDSGLLSEADYNELTEVITDREFIAIKPAATFNFTTGLDITYCLRSNTSVRLYFDYSYSRPRYEYTVSSRMTYDSRRPDDDLQVVKDRFRRSTSINDFSFGMALTVNL